MNLEQKVFERIKRNDIHMRSRWFFYMQDSGKLVMAFLLMACSAVFFGISIAFIAHVASEISWVNFPYSLVVLSVIMALLAYELLTSSFSFYRMRFSVAVAALFMATVFFGYLLFANGHAERIERRLQHFPVYQKMVSQSIGDVEIVGESE